MLYDRTYDRGGRAAYHDKYHQVIVGDEWGLDKYDINKDKWMNVYRHHKRISMTDNNLWISRDDPNTVHYAVHIKESNPSSSCFLPFVIYRYDLRNGRRYRSNLSPDDIPLMTSEVWPKPNIGGLYYIY